jgi:hypothetical protein
MATRNFDDHNDQQPPVRRQPIRPLSPVPNEEPRVIRPHRTIHPVDQHIDQIPTTHLVLDNNPTPTELPAPPTRYELKTLSRDRGDGLVSYCIFDRIIKGTMEKITTSAVLGRSGSGVLRRSNTGDKWIGMPVYLTFEEICVLYLSALDAQDQAKADYPNPDPPLAEGA